MADLFAEAFAHASARRDTGIHRGFRDRRRDVGDEARIERTRDQVVDAERGGL